MNYAIDHLKRLVNIYKKNHTARSHAHIGIILSNHDKE